RLLQRTLANDITSRVHGKEELDKAITATEILFGKATSEALNALDESTFLQVFDGVPQAHISKSLLHVGISIVDILVTESHFLSSNSEARRELKANAISVNKERIDEHFILHTEHLLNHRYVLISKGKKSNFIAVFT
ncbi:MAG: tyrosine--tRNA ligase, partial [Flavobacteriia bacterium]|nr:tyrosine--tRNA ligase [Flavobacteriia bacterium]